MNMITLGIESTAHTFGASIIKKSKVLSNERITFTTKKGGMIPVQVAEHHIKNFDKVIKLALKKAKIPIHKIDLIAVSNAPGIAHCLKIGVFASKVLAQKHNIPIIGVNHCIAHLEIGRILTKAKDPILLYTSGANTQIIAYEAGKYRIFGETLDIGIGNFLDSFARDLGLGFPGGPKISNLANQGKNYIELPYVVKGMDISLGGILTNLKQKIKKGFNKKDLCYSAQETVFAMLLEVSERALAHCNKNELLLGGGVACNTRLQKMAKIMTKERQAKCYILENQFNIDNAAMIALTGQIMYPKAKKRSLKPELLEILPYQRTDEVDVYWR